MPKGRNEWVAEMYIKRSLLVLRVHSSTRLTHTLCDLAGEFDNEGQTGGKKEQNRISPIISHQADLSGLNIKWLSLNIVLHFILHHLCKNFWRQQIRSTDIKLKDLLHLLQSFTLCSSSSSHLGHRSPWRPAWTRSLPICCLW